MEKKLSIIIVTWNSVGCIEDCLRSLIVEAGSLDYEILMVDNASIDDTIIRSRQLHPTITLIRNERNLGFAAANNQAISRSNGELILLFNPDAVVMEGAITAMIEFMEGNPKVGIIGPKIINDDGSIQYTCARRLPSVLTETWKLLGFDQTFSQSKIFGQHLLSRSDYLNGQFVELISGASMLVRAEVFKRCGLLDDRFFFMYEDVEFCLRVIENGYGIYYLPNAVVQHSEGASRKSSERTHLRTGLYSYQSMMQYYTLTKGPLYAVVVRCVIGTGRALLLAKQFVMLLFSRQSKREAARQKLGSYYEIVKCFFGRGTAALTKDQS